MALLRMPHKALEVVEVGFPAEKAVSDQTPEREPVHHPYLLPHHRQV
jgi:hypothetical protein